MRTFVLVLICGVTLREDPTTILATLFHQAPPVCQSCEDDAPFDNSDAPNPLEDDDLDQDGADRFDPTSHPEFLPLECTPLVRAFFHHSLVLPAPTILSLFTVVQRLI